MWSLFAGWIDALGRPSVSAIRISQVVAFSRTHSVHLNPWIQGTEIVCSQFSGGRFCQVVTWTGSTVQCRKAPSQRRTRIRGFTRVWDINCRLMWFNSHRTCHIVHCTLVWIIVSIWWPQVTWSTNHVPLLLGCYLCWCQRYTGCLLTFLSWLHDSEFPLKNQRPSAPCRFMTFATTVLWTARPPMVVAQDSSVASWTIMHHSAAATTNDGFSSSFSCLPRRSRLQAQRSALKFDWRWPAPPPLSRHRLSPRNTEVHHSRGFWIFRRSALWMGPQWCVSQFGCRSTMLTWLFSSERSARSSHTSGSWCQPRLSVAGTAG